MEGWGIHGSDIVLALDGDLDKDEFHALDSIFSLDDKIKIAKLHELGVIDSLEEANEYGVRHIEEEGAVPTLLVGRVPWEASLKYHGDIAPEWIVKIEELGKTYTDANPLAQRYKRGETVYTLLAAGFDENRMLSFPENWHVSSLIEADEIGLTGSKAREFTYEWVNHYEVLAFHRAGVPRSYANTVMGLNTDPDVHIDAGEAIQFYQANPDPQVIVDRVAAIKEGIQQRAVDNMIVR